MTRSSTVPPQEKPDGRHRKLEQASSGARPHQMIGQPQSGDRHGVIVAGRSSRNAAIEVPKRSRTHRTTKSATRPCEPPSRIGKEAATTTTANDDTQTRRQPRAAEFAQRR